MRKKRSDTDWKSPEYWEEVSHLVRKGADTLKGVRRRNLGRGYIVSVPVYLSLRNIADALNEWGYKTRQGKKFTAETVRLIESKTRSKAKPEPLPQDLEEHNFNISEKLMDEGIVPNIEAMFAKMNGAKKDYRAGKYDVYNNKRTLAQKRVYKKPDKH